MPDDIDKQLKKLGVNVGAFTVMILFGIAVAVGIAWLLY
jgi:hypothetical protein